MSNTTQILSSPLNSDAQNDDLIIDRIETEAIRVPLAREFRGSFYHMTHRSTTILRVHTKGGLVGEAYVGDEDSGLAEIDGIIKRELTPVALGKNAMSINARWQEGFAVTKDILRDRRLGLVALAGLDAALWDLFGKHTNLPLWKIWGGNSDRRKIIAIGGYYGDPLGDISEEIAYYQEKGLAGIKFKVGGASPQEDAQRVRAAREAAGDDFIITIDANQGYTVADAIELSQQISDLNIEWFEEPVLWTQDPEGLRDVRMRGSVAVCAGQSEYSPTGSRRLMDIGAIDVCNFDSSWSGGPTQWLKTAAIADSFGVRMAHHEEPQISSHLLAGNANSAYVECFHPDRDPLWWDLIATERNYQDGYLILDDSPGLGWELNRDYIDEYRVNFD